MTLDLLVDILSSVALFMASFTPHQLACGQESPCLVNGALKMGKPEFCLRVRILGPKPLLIQLEKRNQGSFYSKGTFHICFIMSI